MLSELSNEEIRRYSRHLIMPEVAMDGQLKLKRGAVLIVGAGGLGSPVALYLAAAGVGRIGVVDFDVVEHSNLQRQVIHATRNIGRPKLDSAKEAMHGINPEIRIDGFDTRLTSDNALEILREYDIIVDGTDNFPTRYLINDACVLLGKPNVHGSIYRFEGMATVYDHSRGPCYRCQIPEPPPAGLVPSCAEGGVLGILPGVIGTIQATETIKLLLGSGEPLIGRLLLYDALKMTFREVKIRKDPACPICGENPTIDHLIDYEEFCGMVAPIGAEDEDEDEELDEEWEITPEELRSTIDSNGEPVLIDVRDTHEFQICRLPRAQLIPLSQFTSRVHELNSEDELVLYCKNGRRSATALRLLKDAGFRKIKHLRGGIDAWATHVDPSMPRY